MCFGGGDSPPAPVPPAPAPPPAEAPPETSEIGAARRDEEEAAFGKDTRGLKTRRDRTIGDSIIGGSGANSPPPGKSGLEM